MSKSKPPKRKVRSTQGNPIARAYALKALMEVTVTMKVQLYLSQAGEQVEAELLSLARCFTMTLMAAQYDKVTEYTETVDLGLRKLLLMMDNGNKWDPLSVVYIDDAMDGVQLLMAKLTPSGVQAARIEMGM